MLEGLSTLEGYLNRRSVRFGSVRLGTGCTVESASRRMERWNSRNAFPGLIKDLIGVIIVMRFRRGMAEEKGDEEEAAREEGENEKVRGRSWTIDLASWLLR